MEISSSLESLSNRYSHNRQQSQRNWISPTSLSLSISDRLQSSTATEDVNDNDDEPSQTEFVIPMIVVGVRDAQADNRQPGSGWVMYVVGGPNTSGALDRLDAAAVEENMTPEVRGLNGRFILSLTSTDNLAAAATATNTADNVSPADALGALLGAASRDASGAFGITLAAVLFGMFDGGNPAGLQMPASSAAADNSGGNDERENESGDEDERYFQSGDAYEFLLHISSLIGSVRQSGVPIQSIAERLPAVEYRKLLSNTGDAEVAEKCSVCLEQFEDSDLVRPLACSHTFHTECIDTWLSKHVNSCPLCRRPAVCLDEDDNKLSNRDAT